MFVVHVRIIVCLCEDICVFVVAVVCLCEDTNAFVVAVRILTRLLLL